MTTGFCVDCGCEVSVRFAETEADLIADELHRHVLLQTMPTRADLERWARQLDRREEA